MQDQQQWASPGTSSGTGVQHPGGRFKAGAPLGGFHVVEQPPPRRSAWRDLLVASCLLGASVLTAVASLMSWRDYGPALNPDENGWQLADGSLGRGWMAVAVAVVLAVAGMMLVAQKRTAGRIWARVGSTALILLAVLEWAFGDGDSRTGPGLGLWLMLGAGMVLMVLIGSVLPAGPE